MQGREPRPVTALIGLTSFSSRLASVHSWCMATANLPQRPRRANVADAASAADPALDSGRWQDRLADLLALERHRDRRPPPIPVGRAGRWAAAGRRRPDAGGSWPAERVAAAISDGISGLEGLLDQGSQQCIQVDDLRSPVLPAFGLNRSLDIDRSTPSRARERRPLILSSASP